MFSGSWKTSWAGIIGAVVAILTLVVVPLTDDDPNTAPLWTAAITAVLTALGLMAARDNDKTSEDVKTK